MKGPVVILISLLALSGCVSSGGDNVFSWYHPQGGEFLFAYDKGECEAQTRAAGLTLSSELDGPFFRCMHDRGYDLINAQGVPQTVTITTGEPEPQVTLQ